MGMSGVKYEGKIIGANLHWISLLAIGAFLFMRSMGGNLIDWSTLGFEIIFPFYTAIMTGECAKTRSDPMFEVIEAQSSSLFRWILMRYLYTFVTAGVFVVTGMLINRIMNPAFAFGKFLFVDLTTAFFLSSLVVLCSVFTKSSHAAVAVCGVYWLFSLLTKSMLRFWFVPYIYPFLCFADESSPLWFLNKCILTVAGLAMWLVVRIVCKRRVAFTQ